MRGKRMLYTLRLCLIRSSAQRANFLRQKDVFAHYGRGGIFERRKVPLYPKLIWIGNNVHLAAGVSLVTHDVTHSMLNAMIGKKTFQEKVGCIKIGDNVFIGNRATILYNVEIGSNVIIGAESVVTKSIPDNSIVAGVPARVIGSFDDYVAKRITEENYDPAFAPRRQEISAELAAWCWERFTVFTQLKSQKSDK